MDGVRDGIGGAECQRVGGPLRPLATLSSMLHHWIASLNDCAGLFLLILCFAASAIAKNLTQLLREVECLHEDYDRTTQAPERHHWETMAEAERQI